MNRDQATASIGRTASSIYMAAVMTSVVAGALFISGDGWGREAQQVRSPIALLLASCALVSLAGLARSANGRRSPVAVAGGFLGALVFTSLLVTMS